MEGFITDTAMLSSSSTDGQRKEQQAPAYARVAWAEFERRGQRWLSTSDFISLSERICLFDDLHTFKCSVPDIIFMLPIFTLENADVLQAEGMQGLKLFEHSIFNTSTLERALPLGSRAVRHVRPSSYSTMTILQRPVKGARISSFYPVHELPPIASLDSAFQLQEYISLLIRLNVHDVETIVSVPGKSGSHDREPSDGGSDKESAEKEVTVDESCWVYEQLRCVPR